MGTVVAGGPVADVLGLGLVTGSLVGFLVVSWLMVGSHQ